MVTLPWRALETTERKAFLSDFSPQLSDNCLQRTLKRRTPDTCAWILEEAKVKEWFEDGPQTVWSIPGTTKSIRGIAKLWLYGFLGSGKKFISATVVAQLIKRCRQDPRHATCFHFCSISKAETTTTIGVMRGLVAQLAIQNEQAFAKLLRFIEAGCSLGSTGEDIGSQDDNSYSSEGATGAGFDYLDPVQLARLFQCMARYFSRVSIVVSGVDQCHSGLKQRDAEVVDLLMALVDDSDGVIRLMVTTANNPVVQQMCIKSDACPVYVSGREDDIRNYVRDELDRRITRGQAVLDNEEFMAWLEEYLATTSNGAWLWATCELVTQCDLMARNEWQPSDIEVSSTQAFIYGPNPDNNFLAMYPFGPQFDRILRTPNTRTEFILDRVLRWIWIGVEWPAVRLTVSETCEALSLLLRQKTHPYGSSTVNAAEILSICTPLVRFSPDETGFEFTHSSVLGYIEAYIAEDRPSLEGFATSLDRHRETVEELAQLCFRTLANPELVWKPSTLETDTDKIHERNDRNPFYTYAATRWNDVSQGLPPKLMEAMVRNLKPGSERLASWVLEYVSQIFPDHAGPEVANGELYSHLANGLLEGSITPLHISAAFSQPNLCWNMRQEFSGLNQTSMIGTPLYCALVGNAALCPDLDEAPWRRFRHYSLQSKVHLRSTVACMLDLGADCSIPVPAPGRDGEMMSISSQALYTAAWLDDAPTFFRVMESDALYDEELVRLLKSRAFMFDPRSIVVRPVTRPVVGGFRKFLNSLYSYLLASLSGPGVTATAADEELVHDMFYTVCSNIRRDGLDVVDEIASAEESLRLRELRDVGVATPRNPTLPGN